MSKWIRGIYNAAANFNMSGSLRAARGRTLGGNRELMRKEYEQSNESNKPCESNQSCSCTGTTCATTTGTTCATTTGTTCPCTSSRSAEDRIVNTVIIGNDVVITVNRECNTTVDPIERDYAEYISATSAGTIRTEGQGAGSRIRVSSEPRHYQQSHSITTDPVEHITGIQSGVTI